MSAARIGRVRMKAGGADVRVLRQHVRSEVAEGMLRSVNKTLGFEADDPSDPIAAYATFVVFKSGQTSTGFQAAQDSPVLPLLFPSLVAEGLRRDIITQTEAVNVVNRANGFKPDGSAS